MESVDSLLSFLGKNITLEGTVMKTWKKFHRIMSILVECEKCGSIFYCIFGTSTHLYPFICNGINCCSKKFFSHFSRVTSENCQQIKLGKLIVNLKISKSIETVILEIYGNQSVPVFKGLRLHCYALVKLSPVIQKNSSISLKKNFFRIYMQTKKCKISAVKYFGYRNEFFLSKNDFLFINDSKINTHLFYVLVKNLLPIYPGNEGLKACLLLLAIQGSRLFEKLFNDSLINFCSILSENINSNRFFILGIMKYFSKSFFFTFENFKKIFTKVHNKNFFKKLKLIKVKNALIFITCKMKIQKISQINSIFKDIKKILNKKQIALKRHIIILWIEMDKKFKEKVFPFDKYLEEIIDLEENVNLTYVIKKHPIRTNEQIKIEKILSFHIKKTPKKIELNNPGHNVCPFKFSLFDSFRCKKKISALFFKKYVNFIRAFSNSNFSTDSFILMGRFYQEIKKSSLFMYRNSLDFFFIILKLSQCRAKIDFRKQVCNDDVIDVIEIFLDSKPRLFSRLNINLDHIISKTCKKINLIYKFLRLLQKFFFRTGQTLFELEILQKNFKNEINFSEIIEIIEKLKIIKKIKKNLVSLNV